MTTPHVSSAKPTRLTNRDLAMLESLSIARYLTVRTLEWLHVPSWQTRWERHQAQTPTKAYYPTTYLYQRLAFLVDQGWVWRMRRTTQIGSSTFHREDDIYMLTDTGAVLLAECRQTPIEDIHYTRTRPRSYFTLSHGVEIGTFYAALRARIATKPGLHLAGWQGDHLTAKTYDRVTVRRRNRAGNLETVVLPVQPDATFAWQHPSGTERVFVEIDRGTRPVVTWIDKIHAYATYLGSPELQARYGADTFLLLTVTPHPTQQQKLMQATAATLGTAHGRFLFCLQAAIHPTTIGSGWYKIVALTPTSHPLRPTIKVEPYTLIQA